MGWCSGVDVRLTLATGGITRLRISVGRWYSGVHVRPLVPVVLPYLLSADIVLRKKHLKS